MPAGFEGHIVSGVNEVIPKDAPTIIIRNGTPNNAGCFRTMWAHGLGLTGLDWKVGIDLSPEKLARAWTVEHRWSETTMPLSKRCTSSSS